MGFGGASLFQGPPTLNPVLLPLCSLYSTNFLLDCDLRKVILIMVWLDFNSNQTLSNHVSSIIKWEEDFLTYKGLSGEKNLQLHFQIWRSWDTLMLFIHSPFPWAESPEIWWLSYQGKAVSSSPLWCWKKLHPAWDVYFKKSRSHVLHNTKPHHLFCCSVFYSEAKC